MIYYFTLCFLDGFAKTRATLWTLDKIWPHKKFIISQMVCRINIIIILNSFMCLGYFIPDSILMYRNQNKEIFEIHFSSPYVDSAIGKE